MPAAAVIPALIAYIKVVAVKELVVELLKVIILATRRYYRFHSSASCARTSLSRHREQTFYFEKIRVLKAGFCLDTLAWNNGIGLDAV